MKTTVIHHSADFDGIFCREIARKFLPDAELIGWDFKDEPLAIPPESQIYVMDLPVDRVFGTTVLAVDNSELCFLTNTPPPQRIPLHRIIWIDHHKSSIETHPESIPGYRIDGVAACRLAWQWFSKGYHNGTSDPDPLRPDKSAYIDHKVSEPRAVRLAGEYDIWDRRDPNAELFQHGLRAQELTPEIWGDLLATTPYRASLVDELLVRGKALQYARTQENASIIKEIGFTFQWEGLTFLACNAARYNSHLFTAGLRPEHDACFGFKWTGRDWSVSLYHAPDKEHHDLSLIAVKHGGGGHRGACGFRTKQLPFLP